MTIGDVLAAVTVLALMVSSWIALLVLATFAAPQRIALAKERIEHGVGRCAGVGAGVLVAVLVLTVATMHALVGPFRLIPFVVWGALAASAAIGSAGIVAIIEERTADANAPRIIQTSRAAALYSFAGLFPIAGWLIVTPIALVVSIGAALPAVSRRPASEGPSLSAHPPMAQPL